MHFPVFELTRHTRKIFLRDHFPHIRAKFLREFISVQIHVAPVFAPARIQENTPGEVFMYWFRARGSCTLQQCYTRTCDCDRSERASRFFALVAPYCAIPRDYLSDTPLLRAMGFLVSQRGKLGAIPPPPFLSVSPLESMRSGGAIPPLKRGISAILARCPMKTRQMGAIPPSAILSRKGIARYGGVSRPGPLSSSLD